MITETSTPQLYAMSFVPRNTSNRPWLNLMGSLPVIYWLDIRTHDSHNIPLVFRLPRRLRRCLSYVKCGIMRVLAQSEP